jgi:hypothetical protein
MLSRYRRGRETIFKVTVALTFFSFISPYRLQVQLLLGTLCIFFKIKLLNGS